MSQTLQHFFAAEAARGMVLTPELQARMRALEACLVLKPDVLRAQGPPALASAHCTRSAPTVPPFCAFIWPKTRYELRIDNTAAASAGLHVPRQPAATIMFVNSDVEECMAWVALAYARV